MDEHDDLNAYKQVDSEFGPLLEYLKAELGKEYTIFEQVKDYRRKQTVAVVHPTRDLAVRIRLKHGLHTRRAMLTPTDIATIRRHLTSDATQDLWL
jgi:hypothetical protein